MAAPLIPFLAAVHPGISTDADAPTIGDTLRVDLLEGVAVQLKVALPPGAPDLNVALATALPDAPLVGGIPEGLVVLASTRQSTGELRPKHAFSTADGNLQWEWLTVQPSQAGGQLVILAWTTAPTVPGQLVEAVVPLPRKLDRALTVADRELLDALPYMKAGRKEGIGADWVDLFRYRMGTPDATASIDLVARGGTDLNTGIMLLDWHALATDAQANAHLLGTGQMVDWERNLAAFTGGPGTPAAPPAPVLSLAVGGEWWNMNGVKLVQGAAAADADGILLQFQHPGTGDWLPLSTIANMAGDQQEGITIQAAGTVLRRTGTAGAVLMGDRSTWGQIAPGQALKVRAVAFNESGCSAPVESNSVNTPGNWSTQSNNSGAGPTFTPMPVDFLAWDDLQGVSWLGFAGLGGDQGNLELQATVDGPDYVLRARTHNGATATVGWNITITPGGPP